jgi:hypothetical protein
MPSVRIGANRPGFAAATIPRLFSALADLLDRFSYDCLWRAEAQSKKGKSGCGVYLPDLEQPRPPDAPPGMVKLRLIKR